jgi:hypothetical protein
MLLLKDLELGDLNSQLQSAASNVAGDEDAQFIRLLPAAASKAREIASHWDFMGPGRLIDEMLQDRNNFPGGADLAGKTRLQRAAIARLTLGYFQVEDPLPPSVVSLYPEFFRRLAKFISEGGGQPYDEEYFAKDVRYALGVTVPAGALQFDLRYRIGPKLILREINRTKSPLPALSYLRSGAWGRWYNEHLDLRAMRDFNPNGWTAHCARMAEVLELNPSVLGIVGVGWFYDPAVAENSPTLAYIQDTQTKYGAFHIRIGTEPHHIQNAIYKSALRRRLYEEGKYLPACYMLAWPRAPLLAWAKRLETDPGVGFAASDRAAQPRPVLPPLSKERSVKISQPAAQGPVS